MKKESKKPKLKTFLIPFRGLTHVEAETKEDAICYLSDLKSIDAASIEARDWSVIFAEGVRDNFSYILSGILFCLSVSLFTNLFDEMMAYFTNPFLAWMTVLGFFFVIIRLTINFGNLFKKYTFKRY